MMVHIKAACMKWLPNFSRICVHYRIIRYRVNASDFVKAEASVRSLGKLHITLSVKMFSGLKHPELLLFNFENKITGRRWLNTGACLQGKQSLAEDSSAACILESSPSACYSRLPWRSWWRSCHQRCVAQLGVTTIRYGRGKTIITKRSCNTNKWRHKNSNKQS